MLGQGRPRAESIRWCRLALGGFLLLIASFSSALAQTEKEPTLDSTTAPFQFRQSGGSWPIVGAGSEGGLTVRVDGLEELSGQTCTLRYELVSVADGSVVRREQTDVVIDAQGDSRVVALQDDAPSAEGVYEIRCTLMQPQKRLWSRITGDKNSIASKQTPWLVVPAEGSTANEPLPAESRSAESQSLGPATVFRAPAWQPSWIPETATRLVPNVKRVAENWSLSPARDESEPLGIATDLEPMTLRLPDMAAHERHRIRFSIRRRAGSGDVARWALADSATFATARRQDTVAIMTPAVAGDSGVSRYDIIHYSTGGPEFLQLSSDAGTIEVVSVEVFREQTTPEVDNPPRRLQWTIEEPRWHQRATADYSGKLDRFAKSTAELFRYWTATRRLVQNRDWFGIDVVRLPAATESDLQENAFATVNLEAVRAWLSGSGIEVLEPLQSNKSLVDWFGRPTALADLNRRLTTSVSDRLAIRTNDALPVLNDRLRDSFQEFRITPIGTGNQIPSAKDASEYVRVTVWESEDAESGEVIATVINDAPWQTQVTLEGVPQQDQCQPLRPLGARLEIIREDERVELSLPAFAVVNLSLDANDAKTMRWTASLLDGEPVRESIKAQVSEVVGKIGTLSQPEDYKELRNGGFEVSGQVGIVGWMHTQYPSTAVAVDDTEAIEGKHSLRLATDESSAGRAWLVSEPIPVPTSGRLAVSLATRAAVRFVGSNGESGKPSGAVATASAPRRMAMQRVRVSLEGIRTGEPVRFSAVFEVPCDGNWQSRRVVLETDQLDPAQIDAVRLTIDSLSPGRLWIDDVHLHHQFPTQPERAALQGTAFLAIQGLQRGRLKPAADLLQNEWSQYLLRHSGRKWPTSRVVSHSSVVDESPEKANARNGKPLGGVTKETTVSSGASASPEVPPGSQQPSVADRIRGWLPKPLRF